MSSMASVFGPVVPPIIVQLYLFWSSSSTIQSDFNITCKNLFLSGIAGPVVCYHTKIGHVTKCPVLSGATRPKFWKNVRFGLVAPGDTGQQYRTFSHLYRYRWTIMGGPTGPNLTFARTFVIMIRMHIWVCKNTLKVDGNHKVDHVVSREDTPKPIRLLFLFYVN